MGEPSDHSSAGENRKLVDLSELQNLSFGPNWTERRERSFTDRDSDSGRGRSGDGKRDRRSPRRASGPRPSGEGAATRNERSGEVGEERRGGSSRDNRRRQPQAHAAVPRVEFRPLVQAQFYPEDIPFKALCHAMRSNCRTYELFEIGRLILDKPERFVVVARALPQEDGTTTPLYCSVPDGMPFLSEEAAISHVLKEHIEKFFTVEEVEVEAPKGNFLSIGRCGITGELLGPPNYHRYQALLHEHHGSRLSGMSFEKFQSRIEQVKDPEVVTAWLEKMTRVMRYHVKDAAEGEPSSFDGLEAARLFLLSRRRDKVVRALEQMRFHGKIIESMPRGDLRRSLEALWEHQKRFPLETANNLRGRLRRMRFTIYKKGSKGVSYVCAVKRKFRAPDTYFSDSIHALITFIEKNPMVSVSDLPEKFLGLKPVEELEVSAEKAPDIEEVPAEEAAAIVEAHEIKRRERQAAEQQQSSESGPPESGDQESAATATSEASVKTGEQQGQHLTDKDPRVRQMAIDLRWLVSEGFVVEFGDGRLLAVPIVQPGRQEHNEHEEEDSGEDDVDDLPTDIPAAIEE